MSTEWISMLTQLEPDYDYIKKIIDEGPDIKINLEYRNFKWIVELEENWSCIDVESIYHISNCTKRDMCFKWVNDQLNEQKFVTKLSPNQWSFLQKRHAEKFITMFKLKWES